MSVVLPLGLVSALEAGDCVLFVGAGLGRHITKDGKFAPTGEELADELCESFNLNFKGSPLAQVAQIVELRSGREKLDEFLRKRFANLEPDADFQWLATRRWKAIFTTNYDRALMRAYELAAKPPQKPFPVLQSSDIRKFSASLEVPVLHLHGAIYGESPRLVVTQDDYAKYREKRKMLFDYLRIEFSNSPVLYLGYSNQDENWRQLITELAEDFLPSKLPQSYRVSRHVQEIDQELLKAKSVESIVCGYSEFKETASLVLKGAEFPDQAFLALQKNIPAPLADAFKKNPAAVARLLQSWEFVNSAAFYEVPNTATFLRGDRANWSLIAAKHHFERDLEEDLFDAILDFATSTRPRASCRILLGPAGYGVTTTLMTIAVRSVVDKVGPVFYLRRDASVIEGDVEYAATQLFTSPPIFIVDNGAESISQIRSAVSTLRQINASALFIVGERLNEWRQARSKLSGQQFVFEKLSEMEIDAMLVCLRKHGELNKLSDLSLDLQRAAIRHNHGKELLVAMREATEGTDFDAIIEDEYRGIANNKAKDIYLATCALYQHEGVVRDTLLASLVDLDLIELNQVIANDLEGVVMLDELDADKGTYVARARHRTIAEIVWERCGHVAQRDQLLIKVLDKLNLNFGSDRSAFEKMVRNDHLIGQLKGLESKLKFFDTACRKDPESPYVRQHYARMLLREGKPDLALGQIEAGLAVPGRVPRILLHTKGIILSDLAKSIESNDLARKRLIQAEDSFKKGIANNQRDEYSYQSLATLYLEWAKRVAGTDESFEYIQKSEGIIREGMIHARMKDGLWIVSSEVEDWLGDNPSKLLKLEHAVKSTPNSIVARFLLGRAYRQAGNFPKAILTLEALLKEHPAEFRAAIECALAITQQNDDYSKAIAMLRLSTLYGLADPRFIATLGGMLFLNGKMSEAEDVFQETTRREFPAEEAQQARYFPVDSKGQYKNLRGKVLVVKPGFCLIEVEGYKPFLSPSRRWAGMTPIVGSHVEFSLIFASKGPMADRLRKVT